MSISFTPSQRLTARLQGQPVDRAPNFDIIMAFGARHIGAKLRDYFLDYRTLVRANLAMVEDYQLDLLQTISDPYREAVDWGLPVDFLEDDLPMRRAALINDPRDVRMLPILQPTDGKRMNDRLEAIRALHEQADGQIPVLGWVEGALAQVNSLRGGAALMTDFYDRPEWLSDLLERVTEMEIAFARAQIEAGASMIGLGDAIASTISPKMYRAFALPYEQRIFSAVRAMGAIPRLHICGDTSRIVADMARSGAAIIDVDWMVDFGSAARTFAEQGIAICGNFDPVQVMMLGTPQQVYQATWDNLAEGGPRCISATGCEVPLGTRPENMHAQNRALREFQENIASG